MYTSFLNDIENLNFGWRNRYKKRLLPIEETGNKTPLVTDALRMYEGEI